MAYMLDLHLFLGRKLQNGPAEGEEYDRNQVYYGGMPRLTLESETEYCRQLIREGGLEMLEDVTARAYKKYLSMRPGASNASVKRAKEMSAPSLHPMFIGRIQILLLMDHLCVRWSHL
jgi:ATP-dependent RNA helicase DDX54/DBP10